LWHHHCHHQDLESSVIAVRNQKLKEEKEALTKGKKGACTHHRVACAACAVLCWR
jgi:hypothetical protein